MPAQFTVLASGSSGNASLLEADGFGLLIDFGLGPRVLAQRLAVVGKTWNCVSAAILTHTHRDHWNPFTVAHLRSLNVPIFAHSRHHDALSVHPTHDALRKAGLVREYAAGDWFDVRPGLACLPVPVPHDADPTFAFRIESPVGSTGTGWALGFASDLGCAGDDVLAAFAGVDVLAVEYNHDVGMQQTSRRPALLINRVLGDHGHLSNVQAGELTRTVAASGGLRALVQLHLSRECNRPELAVRAGRDALATDAPTATLMTAGQFEPTAVVPIPLRAERTIRPAALPQPKRLVQSALPGLGSA